MGRRWPGGPSRWIGGLVVIRVSPSQQTNTARRDGHGGSSASVALAVTVRSIDDMMPKAREAVILKAAVAVPFLLRRKCK